MKVTVNPGCTIPSEFPGVFYGEGVVLETSSLSDLGEYAGSVTAVEADAPANKKSRKSDTEITVPDQNPEGEE